VVICFQGTIKEIEGVNLKVFDNLTGDTVPVIWTGEILPTINATGVFVGEFKKGKFFIHQINFRKFLNPLDETHLLEMASDSTSEILNSAFLKYYEQLKKK